MTGAGDDLHRFAEEMRRAAARVQARASVVVRKTGMDIVAGAQRRVPVRTGTLKNSIGVDFSEDGLTATAGPTAEYGAYVEFGTSRMAARPYMNPALDAAVAKMVQALTQVIKL